MVTTSSHVTPARWARAATVSAIVLAGSGIASLAVAAPANAGLPEIRISERNLVPACATPERLMTFLRNRNPSTDSRWRDLAQHYKTHGNSWRVRWDYAFFQMLVETNFLTFRTPAGGMSDVHPRQNNFAGIGATGGAPGDSFPNPSTGVLAQIQHLVAYSGERLEHPTAPRTRLKMDEILTKSKALGRPVTFQDLSGRWAVDRSYGHSIEGTAQAFRSAHCGDRQLLSNDGRSSRQRISADWPRPEPAPGNSHASLREFGGREQPSRSSLGRLTRSEADAQEQRPAVTPKRPLQKPVVTSSLRRSDQPEAPATAEKGSAQGSLPSAPPPIIKPKPPAEQQAQPPAATPPALPAKPLATAPSTPMAAAPQASSPALPKATDTPAPPPSATSMPGVATPASAAPPPVSAPVSSTSPSTAPAGAASSATGAVPPRPAAACKIFRASYGGPKTVLIQAQKDGITNYTLLEITSGREQDQTKAFMDAHARGGKVVGEFPVEADALKKSFELCPGG